MLESNTHSCLSRIMTGYPIKYFIIFGVCDLSSLLRGIATSWPIWYTSHVRILSLSTQWRIDQKTLDDSLQTSDVSKLLMLA